mmetsp:Transcript_153977/g.473308  ORF Transcript_153977/g.473308 Transcript_153977/m.473308 type:complete len:206 (+) Transcript_153977:300-917(+)
MAAICNLRQPLHRRHADRPRLILQAGAERPYRLRVAVRPEEAQRLCGQAAHVLLVVPQGSGRGIGSGAAAPLRCRAQGEEGPAPHFLVRVASAGDQRCNGALVALPRNIGQRLHCCCPNVHGLVLQAGEECRNNHLVALLSYLCQYLHRINLDVRARIAYSDDECLNGRSILLLRQVCERLDGCASDVRDLILQAVHHSPANLLV